ncbi:hypothetical protein [Chthonobacter albigriseus]|uniref:hypothetical protein n=1 Tax=Chthonobacter albigriseus TaxID=1683161 RepID=UPI0015EEEA7F|nr:hypothetical protein [Chthonobacter albigriseus]
MTRSALLIGFFLATCQGAAAAPRCETLPWSVAKPADAAEAGQILVDGYSDRYWALRLDTVSSPELRVTIRFQRPGAPAGTLEIRPKQLLYVEARRLEILLEGDGAAGTAEGGIGFCG